MISFSNRPKNISLLLIEDSEVERKLVLRVLERNDFNTALVDEADRLSMATQKLCFQNYDAIIADLSLPDSSGLETINTLVTYAPETPIIVLTMDDQEGTILRSLRRGVQDYIVKGDDLNKALPRAILFSIERLKNAPVARKSSEDSILAVGPLKLNILSQSCTANLDSGCRDICLTPSEFRLLARLAQDVGIAVRRDELAKLLGSHREISSLPTHLSSLRRKLDGIVSIDFISNGYCLTIQRSLRNPEQISTSELAHL